MNYLANTIGVHPDLQSALARKIDAIAKARAKPVIPVYSPPEFNRGRHRECVRLRFNQVVAKLNELVRPEESPEVKKPAAEIIAEVAAEHDMSVALILSPRRTKTFVLARHHAAYRIATERPDLSYPQMGKLLGGRDHTTILHAVRKHAERNGLPQARP